MRKPIQIIVGNIGVVYSGDNEEKAKQTFEEYKDQSEKNYGRAAGEDVIWFENGEIVELFKALKNPIIFDWFEFEKLNKKKIFQKTH